MLKSNILQILFITVLYLLLGSIVPDIYYIIFKHTEIMEICNLYPDVFQVAYNRYGPYHPILGDLMVKLAALTYMLIFIIVKHK